MNQISHPKKIQQIVCAVRCTPESRATATRAIDLALEHGAKLTFFHVLDAEFLGHAAIGPFSLIYQELVSMGEFAMLLVCDRAMRRGVRQVDYLIREGDIRKQLLQFVQETEADILVMGHPHPNAPHSIFKPGEFEAFAFRLQEEGGIRIVMIEPPMT